MNRVLKILFLSFNNNFFLIADNTNTRFHVIENQNGGMEINITSKFNWWTIGCESSARNQSCKSRPLQNLAIRCRIPYGNAVNIQLVYRYTSGYSIYIYIYSIYSGSHIFETKDERQSGRLQPCTIDYLLTINWLVLIFARASLFEPRVIATSFRAIIKKSSSQFGSNNHLQSPLSHGQKSDLSCEFATALRGPIDFIYINIDRIISPILHILHNGRKSYCIKRVTNTALYFRNNINKNGEKLG